jgi:hypothetical protein
MSLLPTVFVFATAKGPNPWRSVADFALWQWVSFEIRGLESTCDLCQTVPMAKKKKPAKKKKKPGPTTPDVNQMAFNVVGIATANQRRKSG